jgi:hypothetical protein
VAPSIGTKDEGFGQAKRFIPQKRHPAAMHYRL